MNLFISPQDIEILGWCLVGSVLPNASWEEGTSLALVGHPFSDGVIIKMS